MGVVTTRFCAETGISMTLAARLASMVGNQPITVALAGSSSASASSVTTTGAVSFGVDTCVPTSADTTATTSVGSDTGGNTGGSGATSTTTTTTTVAGALANINESNDAASTSTAWLWTVVVMLLLGVVLVMLFLWRQREKENAKVIGSLQASKRAGSAATYGNRTFNRERPDADSDSGVGAGAIAIAAGNELYGDDNYLQVASSVVGETAAPPPIGVAIAGLTNPLYPDHSIAAAVSAPAPSVGSSAAIRGPESTYGGDVYTIPMAGGEGDVYAVVPITGESTTVYNTSQEFQESYVDRNAAGTSHHIALPQSAYDQDPGQVDYSEANDAAAADRETTPSSYTAMAQYGVPVPALEDAPADYDTVDDTAATASPAAVARPGPTYGGDVYAIPLEGGGVAAIYGDATAAGAVDYAAVDTYVELPSGGSVDSYDTCDVAVDAERLTADSMV